MAGKIIRLIASPNRGRIRDQHELFDGKRGVETVGTKGVHLGGQRKFGCVNTKAAGTARREVREDESRGGLVAALGSHVKIGLSNVTHERRKQPSEQRPHAAALVPGGNRAVFRMAAGELVALVVRSPVF